MNAAGRGAAPRVHVTLDIGGTKCVAAVVAADGGSAPQVLAYDQRAPVLGRGGAPFLAELGAQIAAVRAAARVAADAVAAVGVAAPGPLDHGAGLILEAPNLPGLGEVALVPFLRSLGFPPSAPVWMENDANCGALAEGLFGAGRGVADFIYLTMSTGVGGGVVSDGRLVRGASGNAAELGHVVVDPRGPPCGCGRRGCLEAFVGGLNLARRIAADPGFRGSSMVTLAGSEPFAALHFFAAARAGDPLARRYLDEFVEVLALGIASLVLAFDPRRVLLGTMAVRSGDLFLPALRAAVLRQVWPVHRRQLEILAAECGADVAILGPLALARTGGDLR